MSKLLKDILTGKDNETYDIGRVAYAFTLFNLKVMMLINVFYLHSFDLSSYGTTVAAITIGFGPFFYLKKDTEPDLKKETPKDD